MQTQEFSQSGTVMEKGKLSLHTWFLGFMRMSATMKDFFCLEFQRQLGLRRYETAFRMMHKIRVYMGKRDALYTLKDMLEFDEGYVGIATP